MQRNAEHGSKALRIERSRVTIHVSVSFSSKSINVET